LYQKIVEEKEFRIKMIKEGRTEELVK